MIENVLSEAYKYFRLASSKLKEMINSNQKKLSNIAATNLDLGIYHLREGNINDAIFRFHLVLLLDKDNIPAMYNMARAYIAKDKETKASYYISKCLELSPHNVEALFLKRIFDKKTQVSEVPISIIKSYYNNFAATYDAEFNIEKGFFAPEDLLTIASKFVKSPKNILDLGCGTGSLGFLLKGKYGNAELVGVEISEKMIKILQEKQSKTSNSYHLVVENDMWEFLLKTKKKFDLIVANLSLHYHADIEKSLKMIKQCLEPNGIFVFSVEKSNTPEQIALNMGNENFCFSAKYIKTAIENSKMRFLDQTETSIKNDRMALICACQK